MVPVISHVAVLDNAHVNRAPEHIASILNLMQVTFYGSFREDGGLLIAAG